MASVARLPASCRGLRPADGRPRLIVRSRAPLRIDLAGGWTDVPAYAERHGGAVVNVAISRCVHTMVRTGGEGVRLHARDLGAEVRASRAADLRADGELALVKAAVRRFAPDQPLAVTVRSDAPPGSGLGGSGALGVALLAALDRLRGVSRMRVELAQAAFVLETQEAGIVGGSQDQYAGALGGLNALVYGDPSVTAARPEVPADALRELEQHLVLCYSGATRFSGETHRQVWDAFARGDDVVTRALHGIRDCALAMRAALSRGDVGAVARVLNENWRHQQALAPGMCPPEMARLEAAARAAGADGAKACGAGAGGCLVALARPGLEADVADAMRGAGGTVLPYAFDRDGVVVWESDDR